MCFHALWKFQSSRNNSMYEYILKDSSESIDRLKPQWQADIQGLFSILKKTSKTIQENYSQPFSCAVLPQEICHRHLYFHFPPTSETPNTPLLVPLIFTISEGCFCSYRIVTVQNVTKLQAKQHSLYSKYLSSHTCRHPDRRVLYVVLHFLPELPDQNFYYCPMKLSIYILDGLFFKLTVLVRIRILPKNYYLCKFFLRY